MEVAVFDVRAEDQRYYIIVIKPLLGVAVGDAGKRELDAVLSFGELQAEIQLNGFAESGRNIEPPRDSAIEVGGYMPDAVGRNGLGVAAVHEPCAAAREGDVTVDGDFRMEIGAEEAVVLAFDLSPLQADLAHGAPPIREQRIAPGATQRFAVEACGHAGRRLRGELKHGGGGAVAGVVLA